jgi:S-adenosylmethionine hydrolase
MPTTVITGRDLVLTIAAANYDAQASSVTLSNEHTIETFQTLDGRAYKAIDDQWTLEVEMLADWGVASSLCEAMWTACETAPNTTLAVSLTAVTGAVFTCNVLPVFPSVGGSAPDAQTVSLSLTVVGVPAENFS